VEKVVFSKRNLAVGLIVGLLLGVISGYAVQLQTIAEKNNLISDLETQASNLQSQIDSKNTELSNLQADLDDSESQVSSLQSQLSEMTSLRSQVTSLQNQLTIKNNEISSLRSQIQTSQTQITHLEQQLGVDVLGVYFSPNGGCEDQILEWISRANVSIDILIYSFTLDSISDALIDAHSRGVAVSVVFETSQISVYSEYEKLKNAGIDVRKDTNSHLMHDKVMIVDGIIIFTGSFNWSNDAEVYNDENLIVISSSEYAGIYETVFTEIWNESEEETPPPSPPPATSNVIISSVHYDAAGDDWDNLNDEYVVIRNNGDAAATLTGWTLKDAVGHTFTFPSFTLGTGNTVTVYTGSGTNTATSLYWGSSAPVWNNDHDTAYLYNQSGQLIDTYTW
jgi:hypothetical protein